MCIARPHYTMKLTSTCILIMILNIEFASAKITRTVPESVDTYDDVKEKFNLTDEGKEVEQSHANYGGGPNGPRFWPTFFAECGGLFQSPIDINLQTAQDVPLEDLKWGCGYKQLPHVIEAINNGHTGGPLIQPYSLDSIHFHWGIEDNFGSEHTVDHKAYTMEMHCVHRRSDLKFDTASTTNNGLVVVAYFFEIAPEDNMVLSNILQEEGPLKVDLNVPIKLDNTFKLQDLVVPFKKNYITYKGSLTYPPCLETVIWIICPFPLTVSKKQMARFRKISEAVGMDNNFRPVQPTRNRTVYFAT